MSDSDYFEGLRDGIGIGLRRGRRAGYVDGYADAKLGIDPPAELTYEIDRKMAFSGVCSTEVAIATARYLEASRSRNLARIRAQRLNPLGIADDVE